MARIFLVEDNESIREAVAGYLKLEDHEVIEFGGVADVLAAMRHRAPDLAVLDVMLPDGSGFALAKKIRAESRVPLVFLTAREAESNRITGFELGADDYVVKPFSPKELVLRVQALLRRSGVSEGPKEADGCWEHGGAKLCLDGAGHRALLGGVEMVLTAAEWKILEHLAQNPGIVVSRERLLGESLGYAYEGSERTIDTHVKNLRAKLGDPGWVETVRGFGYRFAGARAAALASPTLFARTLRAFLAVLAILLALMAAGVVAGVGLSARGWTSSRNREIGAFLQSLVLASYRSTGALDAAAIERATLPYLDESTFLFVFDVDSRIVFAWRRGERLDPAGGGDGGLARNFLARHAAEAVPVELRDGERPIGSVAAGVLSFGDEAAGQSFLRTLAVVGGAGAVVSFLLAVAVAFLFSSRLSRHAVGLAAGLSRIAAGERGVRFEGGGARELDQIGESAGVLQYRLAEEERLRGQWAADVAHDLRTPLAALRSQLEAMTDGVLPVTPARLQRASGELARVEALVADLAELSRIESPGMVPAISEIDAGRFLADLSDRFTLEAGRRGIVFGSTAPAGLAFRADSHLLHRAATNVLQNAFQYVADGGRVGVGISADGPHVVIRVENTGSIPEDEIPRVFDRLHRGEHSRHTPGTGLGLTIARAVMDVHGGSITIANSGAGSVVVAMNVPAVPAAG